MISLWIQGLAGGCPDGGGWFDGPMKGANDGASNLEKSMTTTTSTASKSKSNTAAKTAPKATAKARTPGRFVWFHLRTSNPEAAARFYGEVVGWKSSTMEMEGASFPMFSNAQETVAHVEPQAKGPACFVSYAAVDDVDAAARRVKDAGGKVLGDAVDMPGIGRMVEVQDQDGARFFLYRATQDDAGQPDGAGAFIWNELWAKDTARALAFFTSVFGYSVKDMPMPGMTYHVLGRGKEDLAGLMPAPEGTKASMFVPYIYVADVDAARARALKLGATALGDANDVPHVGRMAVLLDPQGAHFAVMTPEAA